MKRLIISFVVILVLTACQKDQQPDIKTETKVENPLKKEVQIVDLDSNTRPIAVMINNIKVAQPYQTGLNDAYLVYEIIVEGGITRLMAIFKDANNIQIGTIRSSRHYYLDYVLENDAIYTHFGYSNRAKKDISNLKIDNVNGLVDDFYWRDKNLPVSSEHTVYTNIKNIEQMIEKKKYENTTNQDILLNYSADEIDLSTKENSIKANNVTIKYSNYQTNEFIYDEINKNYIRKSNGEIRQDYITKENFTVKNLITYQVSNHNIDSYGRQDINNIGSGEGYYISNGHAIKITWEKNARDSQTIYKDLDGTELIVNDGNTYIEIQPSNQELIIN